MTLVCGTGNISAPADGDTVSFSIMSGNTNERRTHSWNSDSEEWEICGVESAGAESACSGSSFAFMSVESDVKQGKTTDSGWASKSTGSGRVRDPLYEPLGYQQPKGYLPRAYARKKDVPPLHADYRTPAELIPRHEFTEEEKKRLSSGDSSPWDDMTPMPPNFDRYADCQQR